MVTVPEYQDKVFIHTINLDGQSNFEIIDTPFEDYIICIELTKLNNLLVASKNNGTWIMNVKNHKWHRVNI